MGDVSGVRMERTLVKGLAYDILSASPVVRECSNAECNSKEAEHLYVTTEDAAGQDLCNTKLRCLAEIHIFLKHVRAHREMNPFRDGLVARPRGFSQKQYREY